MLFEPENYVGMTVEVDATPFVVTVLRKNLSFPSYRITADEKTLTSLRQAAADAGFLVRVVLPNERKPEPKNPERVVATIAEGRNNKFYIASCEIM